MTDDDAVRVLLRDLAVAWARHDADAYGALFTDDATYTTFLGTHYRGRRQIVESHRALFAHALRGTRLADDVLDIRFPHPGTAVVTSRGDTYKGEQPGRLGKVQTYTLVREPDGWRVAAFHNTKRRRVLEALSFRLVPAARPDAHADR